MGFAAARLRDEQLRRAGAVVRRNCDVGDMSADSPLHRRAAQYHRDVEAPRRARDHSNVFAALAR
jgi:hypothetical protein